MAAYFVLTQQIVDMDRYRGEYVPGVIPFLRKHGGTVLVSSLAEPAAAEGEPPNSVTVIRFPDADSAWAFLGDPDYQPLKELRHSVTARGQAVIVPEFTPAG